MFGSDRKSTGAAQSHRLVALLPDMPPAKAAAALADIDRRVLTGEELVLLVGAECRVQSWIQAGLAESMDELAHCPDAPVLQSSEDAPVRVTTVSRFAADEVALAASVSPGTANWHLHRAGFIRRRLPVVWQAWRAGHLTQAKVFACYDELVDCADVVIDEFENAFFDDQVHGRDGLTAFERAVADTAGQFRDRVRRLVGRLDADVVRRRRDRRVRGRRVVGRHDRDGVGYLSGTDMPVESVAAAYEYVDAIARAMKNDGDQRSLDALRADVYTDLLTGGSGYRRFDLFGHPDDDDSPAPEPAQPAADGPNAGEQAVDRAGPSERPPASPPGVGPVPDGPLPGEHVPDEPSVASGRSEPTVRPRPMHVVAPYDLLAGGDTPGEVDGYGPIPAEVARRLIHHAGRRRSVWAVTVVDPATGRVIIHVRRRWRPAGAPARPGPEQLTELVLPVEALTLTPTDVDPGRLLPVRLLRRLLRLAGAASSDPCEGSHERVQHDATRSQRNFVRARDRRCCFPGCGRRAISCDLDHHRPWEQGGPTCACNLRPLCRRHHEAKQHPGWLVALDTTTGTTVWTSPHGARAANDTHRLDPTLYLSAEPGAA